MNIDVIESNTKYNYSRVHTITFREWTFTKSVDEAIKAISAAASSAVVDGYNIVTFANMEDARTFIKRYLK